jgi:hypothetical protein
MGASAPLGFAMRRVGLALLGSIWLLGAGSETAWAGDRFAVVVTGASGGPQFAEKYDRWRDAFVATLRQRLAFPDQNITVLAEHAAAGVQIATRERVRATLTELGRRLKRDDLLLVLLIGHGTGGDGNAAKFNLVGPDLNSAEWGALTRPIAARLVFVDTTGGSFPYLEAMAGPHRLVITANDSPAQQFETVMPEFFVKAFEDDSADLDRDGKTSLWEAFAYVSAGVKRWFEERGQLATERPLLDDTGDGVGREIDGDGPDGGLARTVYLHPDADAPVTEDPELAELLRRRAAAQAELDQLREERSSMSPEEYDARLEKLLLELAQIDRRVRSKS